MISPLLRLPRCWLRLAPSARKGKSGAARLVSRKSDARDQKIRTLKRALRLAGRAGMFHIDAHESLASAGRRLAAHCSSWPDEYGQDAFGGGADAGTCLGHDRPAAEASGARNLRSS